MIHAVDCANGVRGLVATTLLWHRDVGHCRRCSNVRDGAEVAHHGVARQRFQRRDQTGNTSLHIGRRADDRLLPGALVLQKLHARSARPVLIPPLSEVQCSGAVQRESRCEESDAPRDLKLKLKLKLPWRRHLTSNSTAHIALQCHTTSYEKLSRTDGSPHIMGFASLSFSLVRMVIVARDRARSERASAHTWLSPGCTLSWRLKTD